MAMPSHQELRSSVTRGIDWILQQQLSDGSWRADFGFRHGPTSSWSTAFVANRLPEEARCRRVCGKALDFLISERLRTSHPDYGDGWGYNESTPPDLDTTIEVVRFINGQGWPSSAAGRFVRLAGADGGFSTYTHADARQITGGAATPTGWTSSHPEIVANVLQWARGEGSCTTGASELIEVATAFIRRWIIAKGYELYWYDSTIVGAALFERSLPYVTRLKPVPLFSQVTRLQWEVLHNPFVAAHAIEVALSRGRAKYKRVLEKIASALVQHQQPNGSWRPLHVLRVPYPDAVDPRYVQHTNADYRSPLITVSAVVRALSLLSQRV